ncbi:ubiquinone biosynthesis protein COQ9, mitochondrial [Sabethes cyaneus]|uniref:ubiquinone biosynthesis protein COQ9, mitochondrial n=1 Tax=Sabethes cyaneus TaxID=53552 RepID=UPI00237D7449|nr:ubiquinone biosynthesis protein COQ9, mitochondrial [Sabethes cyaneus]
MNSLIQLRDKRWNASLIYFCYNRRAVLIKSISGHFLNLIRSCSTTSGKDGIKSNFDNFRAREEQKQEDLLKQRASNNTGQIHEGKKNAKVLSVKSDILNAALSYVSVYGWSKQSISKGALSINYPSVVNGLFPLGAIELVQHFHRQCNENMLNYLKEESSRSNKAQNPTKFAQKAIEVRLRMQIPYIKNWPQAMGLMALPPNIPNSLAHVLTLADDICYYAGDRSIDFNWYTRRIALASIYKATELYMLQDNSVDYEKTWKFLERRIDEASVVHDFFVKSEDATSHLQNAFGSAFSTARNILGLNFGGR